MSAIRLTPMLEQYFELKRQVPDAILFFRMGDFYEMFFEDAQKAAPLLDLVLTARGKGGESETPMCGIPFHAAEQYIARLVKSGLTVALGEQIVDPANPKGLMKREVVRVITPGTIIEGSLLERDSCYLVGLAPDESRVGAAWLDISTGDFFATSYESLQDPGLRDDLARFDPREMIVPGPRKAELQVAFAPLPLNSAEESQFESENAFRTLTRRLGTQSLRGFGLEKGDPRIAAAAATLTYATNSHKRELTHVSVLRVEGDNSWLELDASTLQNLEVFDNRDARAKATLWNVLNVTRTAMGSRTLRRWLCRPLKIREEIFARHDAVDELSRDRLLLDRAVNAATKIGDLERLNSRITLFSASPRDCVALADSLDAATTLRDVLEGVAGPLLQELRAQVEPPSGVASKIRSTLSDEPPAFIRDGGAVRSGVHPELDELRTIARDSKSILLRIETEERARTGISSLKIRYNSVFGYYIEVSKSNLARVPDDYIRKQTLVNAERYITPELKELESKIIGAEERARVIEIELFETLMREIAAESPALMRTARSIGDLDALMSLTSVAIRNRFVRAQLSEVTEIDIEEGRHPVVETLTSEKFIPNSTCIDQERNAIQLITGPNMGGKSTYLRQVALIVLLNQIGSFVPAARARLGIFDRIFTRVGASDNLARGESTFMVEMQETANILNNSTDRSLIILDEVGRGTATFDGLSLAWAIVEFLHDGARRTPLTLFATHYHELTDLAKTRARVGNCNVAVKEWNEQIIFLRKVVEGAADKSYGIQVAKLAGIPQSVIERAREILSTLERKERAVVEATLKSDGLTPAKRGQLSLFDSKEEQAIRELRELDLNTLSPLDALNALHRMKTRLTES